MSEERHLIDFSDRLEWNLITRETILANENAPNLQQRLPPKTWPVVNSNVVMVGVASQTARSTWYTGGWASCLVDFKPSYVSQFPAGVETASRRLRLGFQTLIVFPKITPNWILEVKFPYWFRDVFLEIWRYDGRDEAFFDQLDRMEFKLNQL